MEALRQGEGAGAAPRLASIERAAPAVPPGPVVPQEPAAGTARERAAWDCRRRAGEGPAGALVREAPRFRERERGEAPGGSPRVNPDRRAMHRGAGAAVDELAA